MPEPPAGPRGGDEPELGRRASADEPVRGEEGASGSEGYEIAGFDPPPDDMEPIPPVAAPPPGPRTGAEPSRRPRRRDAAAVDPAESVPEVWSRWAEWGPTLGVLAMIFLGALLVVILAVQLGAYSLAFFLIFAACLAMVVASYPIVVTLERPVRVTPEQAIRDFYAALSHHRPHYRRMWLLLGARGRSSAHFSTPEEFRRYWEGMLGTLSGEPGARFNPLRFEASGFRAEKSAGARVIGAKYLLTVKRRGGDPDRPVATFPFDTTLVRGPDQMWYLTDGTLPEARTG